MLPILISLLLWLPAVIGLGSLIADRVQQLDSPDAPIWLRALFGLAMLGSAATTLNLFIPINSKVAVVLCIGGWLLFLYRGRYWIRAISPQMGVCIALLLIFVANSAAEQVTIFDSGLYHLQSIKWITQSKTPLGLANLHGRLGFNQSWFSIAAALEIPLIQGKSSFVLNPLLLLICGLAVGNAATAFMRDKKVCYADFFLLLTLVPWLLYANSIKTSSPEPDFAVLALTLLLLYTLIKCLEAEQGWLYYCYIGFFISVFAVTVKLSALPLLLGPVVGLVWNLVRRRQVQRPQAQVKAYLILAIGTGAALLLPWVIRGGAMSGCLAYPVSFSCFPSLSWAVPLSKVELEATLIKSWARLPHGEPEKVLANWDWLVAWLERVGSDGLVNKVTSLLLLGSITLWGARSQDKVKRLPALVYVLPMIVCCAGLVFWFLTAPKLRFADGFIWGLGLAVFSAGLCALYQAYQMARHNRMMLAVCVVISLIYADSLLFPFEKLKLGQHVAVREWPEIPEAEVYTRFTYDGAKIFVPAKDGQCWLADLPCAKRFDPDLRIVWGANGLPLKFYATSEQAEAVAHITAGEQHLAQGLASPPEFRQAIELYEQALGRYSREGQNNVLGSMQANLGLGIAYCRTGENDKCFQSYEKAGAVPPELLQNFPPQFVVALRDTGYLDTQDYETYRLPYSWKGSDEIAAEDLARAAPPFVFVNNNGEFTIAHTEDDGNNIMRVSVAPNQSEGETWITMVAGGDELPVLSGQTVIWTVQAQFSDSDEKAEIQILQHIDGEWGTSNYSEIKGASWQQWAIAEQIQEKATRVRLAIRWEPQTKGGWLELGDMQVYVSPDATIGRDEY